MRPAPLLEARGIHHAFGAAPVLDGVDLALAPGEVLGLVVEGLYDVAAERVRAADGTAQLLFHGTDRHRTGHPDVIAGQYGVGG